MRLDLIKFGALSIVLTAGIMFSAVPGIAFEQGHMKIEPGFKAEEQWDSNIFYDRDNEKSDFVTLLTPSIYGEFGFGGEGKHKLTADYSVELGMFGEHDDQNYGNHDANAGVALDFDEYTLDINNRFQFTSSRAGTEFEHRNLRKIDTFDTVLGWHYNKLDFDTGYEFYVVDYLSDTLKTLNRYENTGWMTGYVELQPKTKGLLEFQYKNIQYPDTGQRNGNAYRVMGGVEGEITAKITGIIKAGYKIKQYENSERNDFANAVTYAALLYDINDRTDMTFSYTREPFESTYGNNNYYTGDHFAADLNYRFGGNFLAKVDGMYLHNAYPSAASGEANKRTDNEWAVGAGLDYNVKDWMVTGVGYKFHQRESNIGSRRYDQHVVSADVSVKF